MATTGRGLLVTVRSVTRLPPDDDDVE